MMDRELNNNRNDDDAEQAYIAEQPDLPKRPLGVACRKGPEKFTEHERGEGEIASFVQVSSFKRPSEDAQRDDGLQESCEDNRTPLDGSQNRFVGIAWRPADARISWGWSRR